MKIKIELQTGEAAYLHTGDSLEDWEFMKTIVGRLLDLNPDKPTKKIRGPYKKVEEAPEKHDTKKKFTKAVITFLRENCDTKNNKMLALAIEGKFGFKTTHNSVAWQLTRNDIHRKTKSDPYYDPGEPEPDE